MNKNISVCIYDQNYSWTYTSGPTSRLVASNTGQSDKIYNADMHQMTPILTFSASPTRTFLSIASPYPNIFQVFCRFVLAEIGRIYPNEMYSIILTYKQNKHDHYIIILIAKDYFQFSII